MAGGLMQLVAYGAQDIYLTGNPQVTFFKVVYRRYTNFAIESIEQTFNGNCDFGKRVSVTIARSGDLITHMYVQVDLPELQDAEDTAWCPEVGHALILCVEVEIGGQRIDRHYGEWLHIWKELTLASGKVDGYNKMIGNVPELTNFGPDYATKPRRTVYVPLQFWFCRNAGLAIPLIALQYHEVRVNVEFRRLSECLLTRQPLADGATAGVDPDCVEQYSGPSLSFADCSLYVDYIYLDTDERRRFAQFPHEYLIDQLQFTGDEVVINGRIKLRLNLNHPNKELVWASVHADHEKANQWFNFTNELSLHTEGLGYSQGGVNPMREGQLKLNGQDRFSVRQGQYFNWVQCYQHHTNIPEEGINVYSFALNPEDHQPSGTANFSRIDNSEFNMEFVQYQPASKDADGEAPAKVAYEGKLKMYSVNYNVLRVMSGMGGVAYSN